MDLGMIYRPKTVTVMGNFFKIFCKKSISRPNLSTLPALYPAPSIPAPRPSTPDSATSTSDSTPLPPPPPYPRPPPPPVHSFNWKCTNCRIWWQFIFFFSAVVNVATGKPAEQKRDWSDSFTWSADKAVDGCYLRDFPEVQGCCSASVLDLNFDDPADNYWRVNLTRLYQVESIVIYPRIGM